jgi:hypothetical protein
MRKCIFLFFLVSLARGAAQDTNYSYREIDELRQNMQEAQRDWTKSNPELETHVGTARKSQVLNEIEQSKAAAANFTSLEQAYYSRKAKALRAQIEALSPNLTPKFSTDDLSGEMMETMSGLLRNLADDRESIQNRLAELNKPGTPLTNDQVLVRDQLNRELNQVQESYFVLEGQLRILQKDQHTTSKDLNVARAGLESTLAAILNNTEKQAETAKQEARTFDSYYDNLRLAVYKRPDDPVPPPLSAEFIPKSGNAALKSFIGVWDVLNGSPQQVTNGCALQSAELKLLGQGSKMAGSSLTLSYGTPPNGSVCRYSKVLLPLQNPEFIDSYTVDFRYYVEVPPFGNAAKRQILQGALEVELGINSKNEVLVTLDQSISNDNQVLLPELYKKKFRLINKSLPDAPGVAPPAKAQKIPDSLKDR